MPKIITVTANTAIDTVITIDHFALGDTVVAQSTQTFVAGKGVNVAKALEALSQPVTALGFVGQQSQTSFTARQSSLLQTDFIAVNGSSRSNITLIVNYNASESHIRTTGYQVTEADCLLLITQLKAYTQAGDIVVLSGSLPQGAPLDLYNHLITVCHTQGAYVLLDSSGTALKTALSAQPDLIKPNQHELEALIGEKLLNEQAIIEAAQTIIKQGITCIVVSRGKQGAIAVTENEVINATLAGNFNQIISTIGCGDALVGGLALATLQELDLKAMLTLAVSCGTANLFNAEPGRIDKKLLKRYSGQIITQLR